MFLVVRLLSHVLLFATPWTAAHQGSLSFTISLSLLKLMSIESVMPSNHLILSSSSCLQSFLASGSFLMSQLFISGGQSIGASASASVQFSSVAQSCLTLCNPMDCSTPGLPVYHQLLEFTQTHVHRVSDTIQSSPSPPSFNLSQHQGLFQ